MRKTCKNESNQGSKYVVYVRQVMTSHPDMAGIKEIGDLRTTRNHVITNSIVHTFSEMDACLE